MPEPFNELGVWPFDRADHARVIDAMHDGGASAIAFDVELAHAGRTMPTMLSLSLRLNALADRSSCPPSFNWRLPGKGPAIQSARNRTAIFREHSWLANVNVYPSSDGRIWTMTYGGFVDEGFQYSLAATLAGRALRDEQAFYVDYGIDINTIPRLSYIDLLTGRL